MRGARMSDMNTPRQYTNHGTTYAGRRTHSHVRPIQCQRHFDDLGLVAVGALPIDMEKARERFPKARRGIVYLGWDGRSAAVNGITISESMFPSSHDWERWYGPRGLLPEEGPTIMRSLGELLAEVLGPNS